jgi:hypothetical protein
MAIRPHSAAGAYGRTLVPLVTVRTVAAGSPETGGAVAGKRYLAGLAVPDDGPAAFSGAGATIVELMNCPQPDAFEQQNGRLPSSVFIKQRPWAPGKFVAWPTYQLTFDRDQAASDNELGVETAVAGLAGVVADALAAIGALPAALRDIAAAHAAWYDVAAAEGLRQEIPLDEARRTLLADFARAEREFLVRQTRDLQARLESSGWPAKIREARAMEQQQVDRAKAIGWASTIAAGLVTVPGTMLASYMLMTGAYGAFSAMLTTALMNSGHEDIAIEAAGAQPIPAASLEELRRKLKVIYEDRFPTGTLGDGGYPRSAMILRVL